MGAEASGLALSPDGKLLTSGNAVWSAVDGKLLAESTVRSTMGRPAFGRDGAIANGFAILDAASGKERFAISNKPAWGGRRPYGVSISPDGTMLAAGIGDRGPGEVKLWDLGTGKAVRTHTSALSLYSIAFSGDGRRYCASAGVYHPGYTATRRGEIRAWDIATGKEIFAANGLSSCVYSVALSPDGSRIVAAVGPSGETGPFAVKLRDVDAGREVFTLGIHAEKVEAVAMSPDGKRIASAGTDNVIKLWSID